MWIFKNEKLGESDCYEINFLYNSGKFFIMDNHLAATWCWNQKIQQGKKYGLFHIDKHYDLVDNQTNEIVNKYRTQLTGTIFKDYFDLKNENDSTRLMIYDNYINVFRRLHPEKISSYYFATHDDDSYLEEIESYKPSVFNLQSDLKYWVKRDKVATNWIVNIDLDFFY